MVSIALRTYNNDIGDMIDHQQIDESISHCRHILETYPKHVDTYRLLGKAYLEAKRYGDASDILQRVLSSVPEDFIAHVGMSIIREDEGNLDAAIYHMERAFETQPSNHAIQDELRRLHTNRDGIEPPRIRLTRGALARMYAHGHLFDQAVAELLAALSEDAQRFDLQTLLAEMYYQTGKKVDAAETCTKILEKLPYCLKANQLLTLILEENDRADDAQRYRQKWEALDPYAAFVDKDYTTPEMVPESRVKIERLEWEPDSFLEGQEGQPAWASSLGVSLDTDEGRGEEIPPWLGGEPSSEDEGLPGFEEEEGDFVEDFFSSDEPSEPETFEDLEPETEDWFPESEEEENLGLFGQEVEEAQPEEEELPDFLSEEPSDDDWMAEFAIPEDSDSTAARDDTLEIKDDRLASIDEEEDDWLASLSAGQETESTEEEATEEEDWFASLEAEEEELPPEIEAEEEQEADDWLASLGVGQEAVTEEEEEEATEEEDWFASLETEGEELPPEAEAEEEQEADDWLASLGVDQEAETEEIEEEKETEEEDWFASLETEGEELPPEAEVEEEQEADDWLASLGVDQEPETEEVEEEKEEEDWFASLETEEEELPSEGEAEEDQGADDWLASLGVDQEAETEEEEEDLPSAIETESEEEEGDWLAALDEDQEQKAEDVELPEFLKEAGWQKRSGEEEEPSEFDFETEDEQPEEIEQAEIPDWIQDLAPSPDSEPSTPISEVSAEAEPEWLEEIEQQREAPSPDWLSELDESQPEAPEEIEVEEPAAGKEIEADDLDMAWLESLAAKQGVPDEELVTSPEQRADAIEHRFTEETEPEPESPLPDEETESEELLASLDVQPETEISEEEGQTVLEEEDDFDMDWLEEIGQEAAEEAAATSLEAPVEDETGEELETVEQVEDQDDWMAALDEQTEEETPDWLTGLDTKAKTLIPTEEEPFEEEVQAVIEEEDDFDMDWLDEIGKQAAEEAAATSIEPSVEEQTGEEVEAIEQAEEQGDWMAALDEQTEEESPDWLAGLDAEIESLTSTEEELPEETPQSVLEEEDDFAMDWLDEIGQESAEEAAETTIEQPEEEETSEEIEISEQVETQEEWLAPLDEQAEEEGPDWLSGLDAEPEAPTPTEEAPQEDAEQAVIDEEDDFDTGWLKSIGKEAAEEAAATSIEPPEEEIFEVQPGEETAAWLSSVGTELTQEQEVDDKTTGEFLSSLEEITDEQEASVEEYVETSELPVLPDQDEFESAQEESLTESEVDEFEPREDSLTEQDFEEEEIVPTQTEEWQPESAAEAVEEEEAEPEPQGVETPTPPPPDSPQSIFDNAKEAAEKGDLAEALVGFNKLVKKGKLINEVIEEVSETLRRHPVNVEFWQLLGDSYMRIDDLQQALDAYTKAEELLR